MDRKALIGLLSGITVVIALMIGVGLVNTRPAEGADGLLHVASHECGAGYGLNPGNETCGRR